MIDVFIRTKNAVCKFKTLGLNDPTKDLTLEVDVSQKGLAACLPQDDTPI